MERTDLFKMTRVPFLRQFMFLMFIFCACDITARHAGSEYLASYSVDEDTKYEVIAKKVNVRSAPTTTSNIVGSLNTGDIVNVKSIQNGWAKFSLHGKDCYIKADFLKVVAKKEVNAQNNFKQQNTQREAQTQPRHEPVASRNVSSAHVMPTTRKVIKQNDFKGWHPFVEVQPIIVCAKGAKPRFDFLGGVTKGINRYISVGGGTGLSTDFHNPLVLPLFARLTIQNKELDLTPLFLLDAGYDFNLKQIKGSAIRLNPTLGIKTGGFYIGAGYMAIIPTIKDADMVHNVNFKLGWEFDANSKNSAFAKSMNKFFKKSLPNFFKKTYIEIEGGAGLGLRTEQIDENESEKVGNNYHLQLAWSYQVNEKWDIGIGTGYRKYSFKDTDEEELKFHSIPIFLRNQFYLPAEMGDFRPYVGADLGVNLSTLKDIVFNEKEVRNKNGKLEGREDIVYKQHSTNFLFRPRIGVVYKDRVNAALSYTHTSFTATKEDSEDEKSTRTVPSLDLTLGVRLW